MGERLTEPEAEKLGALARMMMMPITRAVMRSLVEAWLPTVRRSLAEESPDNLVRLRGMSQDWS